MMWHTHALFAVLLAFLFVPLGMKTTAAAFILLALGSLVPDLDLHFGEHRKHLHNVFAAAGFTGGVVTVLRLLNLASTDALFAAGVFLTGYLAHLLLDSVTLWGLMPLWPLRETRFRGPFRVGGDKEGLFFVVLILVIAIILLFR